MVAERQAMPCTGLLQRTQLISLLEMSIRNINLWYLLAFFQCINISLFYDVQANSTSPLHCANLSTVNVRIGEYRISLGITSYSRKKVLYLVFCVEKSLIAVDMIQLLLHNVLLRLIRLCPMRRPDS